MTIESGDILKLMLENHGRYPGDPQARAIYQYYNPCFRKSGQFLIVMPGENEAYMLTSPCVFNPCLVWSRAQGLTKLGQKVLTELGGKLAESPIEGSQTDASQEPKL